MISSADKSPREFRIRIGSFKKRACSYDIGPRLRLIMLRRIDVWKGAFRQIQLPHNLRSLILGQREPFGQARPSLAINQFLIVGGTIKFDRKKMVLNKLQSSRC